MKSFTVLEGLVAPMDRANVDTDMIIPKQFLKSIKRSGFGPNLFDEMRYLDEGQPGEDCSNRPLNPDFPLNQPRYHGATVLLARENFGCGSFADIFYNNCFKNGILPVVLPAATVEQLFTALYAQAGYRLEIDLAAQEVRTPAGEVLGFEVDVARKQCLLKGLDDIGVTLESAAHIHKFENRWREQSPWLFNVIGKGQG